LLFVSSVESYFRLDVGEEGKIQRIRRRGVEISALIFYGKQSNVAAKNGV